MPLLASFICFSLQDLYQRFGSKQSSTEFPRLLPEYRPISLLPQLGKVCEIVTWLAEKLLTSLLVNVAVEDCSVPRMPAGLLIITPQSLLHKVSCLQESSWTPQRLMTESIRRKWSRNSNPSPQPSIDGSHRCSQQ